MSGPRLFSAAAVVFAAGGLMLRLAPVTDPAATASAATAAIPVPTARPLPAVEQGRFAPIVANNAFSAARTPPKPRFVPEGLRRDTQPPPPKSRKPAEPVARLFGITRGPGGAVALIDADPAVPGAEVYEVGDEVGGARLTNISETTVTLSRPSGQLVLRLPDAGDRR